MTFASVGDSESFPFRSRWGYHCVDYATYRKLKELHKCYWKAVRGLAAWFRWNAKQPQNRIITERIKDDAGRVTGKRVLGPWEEPRYSQLFGQPTERRGWLTIPEHLTDHGIVSAFQQARKPRAREEVTAPVLSVERIDELYEKLKAKP